MFVRLPQDEEGHDEEGLLFWAVELRVRKRRRIKILEIANKTLFSDIVFLVLERRRISTTFVKCFPL